MQVHDMNSVWVESGSVEVVNHFTYAGSNISREGDLTVELDCRITKAARAFGSLRKPILQDRHLSIVRKCQVHAVEMAVLLQGGEMGIEG